MYQKIVILGNLGRDPEMRYVPSGQAVTSFSVATNETYTNNSGEKVKKTAWFRVSTWGKQAESCSRYLKKGQKVLVEGHLTYDQATGGPRIWTGQDGQPRSSFEINAAVVRFLSSKEEDSEETEKVSSEVDTIPDENIPF